MITATVTPQYKTKVLEQAIAMRERGESEAVFQINGGEVDGVKIFIDRKPAYVLSVFELETDPPTKVYVGND